MNKEVSRILAIGNSGTARFKEAFHHDDALETIGAFSNVQERHLTVAYVKEHERISNSNYQELANISNATASRELRELKDKGIFESVGTRGAGVAYRLIGSIGSIGS